MQFYHHAHWTQAIKFASLKILQIFTLINFILGCESGPTLIKNVYPYNIFGLGDSKSPPLLFLFLKSRAFICGGRRALVPPPPPPPTKIKIKKNPDLERTKSSIYAEIRIWNSNFSCIKMGVAYCAFNKGSRKVVGPLKKGGGVKAGPLRKKNFFLARDH